MKDGARTPGNQLFPSSSLTVEAGIAAGRRGIAAIIAPTGFMPRNAPNIASVGGMLER